MRKFSAALVVLACSACFLLRSRQGPPTSYWAVSHYDSVSIAKVAAHAQQLNYTITTTLFINPQTFRPERPRPWAQIQSSARRIVLVTTDRTGNENPAIVRGLASSPDALGHLANDIVGFAVTDGNSGLLLQFRGLSVRDNDALITVCRAISDSARAHSLSPIVVEVPAGDTAAYPGQLLNSIADLLLVTLGNEHSPETQAGPLASREWFIRNLGERVAEFGTNRVVAAVPLSGYFWRKGTAQVVSFLGAERLAQNAGTALTRDPVSGSLHAVLPDGEVWVMDYELVRALVAEARKVGVTRIALWGVGGEDPEIWNNLR